MDGGFGFVIDDHRLFGSEAHTAPFAQFVLGKTVVGIADGPDDSPVEIGKAPDIVINDAVAIHQKRVHRKIPAHHVEMHIVGIDHRRRVSAVGILQIPSKGGDFVHASRQHNADGTEARPGVDDIVKPMGHLVGQGIRRQVEIFGHLAEKHIPDGASHNIELFISLFKKIKQIV